MTQIIAILYLLGALFLCAGAILGLIQAFRG